MKNHTTKIKTLFTYLIASVSLLSPVKAEKDDPAAHRKKTLNVITKNISASTKTTLYEGLPHQKFESVLLKKELLRKDIIKLAKFPFYKKTLTLSDQDTKQLKSILSETNTFGTFYPYNGTSYKRCGGFHPDYGIEFKTAKETIHVLVCFGCQEFKITHPEQKTYCDINKKAYKKLTTILKKYHLNRPSTKNGKL